MKTKFLLAIILLTASLSLAFSEGGTPAGEGHGEGLSNQKVVVNNYYYLNGYEYASRITRFHRSFVSFDFYSPMYTEIYWYRYKPYTWGVSIYDDWYYYGAVATRNAWRSGFGGSYWWGYDPWRDYNPWMGYGWSSWYSPGVSFSVNFYLGRPYYHYPMAWNRWHHQNYRSFSGPVNIVNNNTYNYFYGSQRRDSRQSPPTGYNPSHPYNTGDRPGYTVTGGRSSVSGSTTAVSSGGRTQANTPGGGNSDRPAGGNASGNAGNQSDRNNGNNGSNSNNGLRMGQYRRGVAQPANPDDNGLPRTNNPNVNDRTDPGREQGNSANSRQQGNSANNAGQQGNVAKGNRRQSTGAGIPGSNRDNAAGSQGNEKGQTGVDRAPARSSQGQQTQGTVRSTTQSTVRRTTQSTVRTTTQRSTPARRQENSETSSKSQKTVKQDKKETTTKTTGKKKESEKSSSSKRRNT